MRSKRKRDKEGERTDCEEKKKERRSWPDVEFPMSSRSFYPGSRLILPTTNTDDYRRVDEYPRPIQKEYARHAIFFVTFDPSENRGFNPSALRQRNQIGPRVSLAIVKRRLTRPTPRCN